MSAPLVSIGLPVYNGERFLGHALDTLLGQTLEDFELIISDNASTDRTADICADYAARDPRIRYIRQATNTGPPRNWNFVALQARGQYFKWASANDFCESHMLEKCVSAMRNDPAVVLCHGRTCIADEETHERTAFAHDISATDPRPGERFRSVVRSIVLNNALSGVIRLDALRRTGLIPLYLHGDLVLTAELALHGHLVLLPEILFYRRIGRQSSSMQLKPADLQAFFYPGSTPRLRFERWRRRIDYSRAVMRAPIGLSEKLSMFALGALHYAGWAVPPRARQVIKQGAPSHR